VESSHFYVKVAKIGGKNCEVTIGLRNRPILSGRNWYLIRTENNFQNPALSYIKTIIRRFQKFKLTLLTDHKFFRVLTEKPQ
jgi:hypothetical protein